MESADPPRSTQVIDRPADGTEAIPRPSRTYARRGLLAVLAILSTVTTVLALIGLAGTGGAPATPSGPQVNLAAAREGAATALRSLSAMDMPAPTSSTTIHVMIQNYAFSPATISVAPGTTVVWTNQDTAPHTVTVSDGPVKFSSPTMQKGATYTYTFTQPGSYKYYCAVHPDMVASVTVTAQAASAPPAPAAPPAMPMPMPMPMPSAPATGGACLVSGILNPLIQHIQTAHLNEPLDQQIQDILNLDQYIKTHTALIATMLNPVTNGQLVTVLNGMLTPLVQHIQTAHLNEPLDQQIQDILNLDQYIKTHIAVIAAMLQPLQQSTC